MQCGTPPQPPAAVTWACPACFVSPYALYDQVHLAVLECRRGRRGRREEGGRKRERRGEERRRERRGEVRRGEERRSVGEGGRNGRE